MVNDWFHIPGEWVLVLDGQVTRRKYYHFVVDPNGDKTFHSRLFHDCTEHAIAMGAERLILLDTAKRSTKGALTLSLTKRNW